MLSTDHPLERGEVLTRLAFIESRLNQNSHAALEIEHENDVLLDHLRWLRDSGYITQTQLATVCADGRCQCDQCSGGQQT